MYDICMPGAPRSQKTLRFPETRVTYDCELLCGYGDSNPDPLEKEFVLLVTEPSLKLQELYFLREENIHEKIVMIQIVLSLLPRCVTGEVS